MAAVFFAWKLKPTQRRTVGNKNQFNLLGIGPEQQIQEAIRLRIEYAIPSQAFISAGHFLPKDKSVDNDGPIYQAGATGEPVEGDCYLDLGKASGTYRVWALPLWTADEQIGANGENSVVAVIRPLNVKKPKIKKFQDGPGLFDVQ